MGGVKEEEYCDEEVVGLLQDDDEERTEEEQGLEQEEGIYANDDHLPSSISLPSAMMSKNPAIRVLLPSSVLLMILAMISFRSDYSRSLSNANTDPAALGSWNAIWDEAGLGSPDYGLRKQWEMKIKTNEAAPGQQGGLEQLTRLEPTDPNVDVTTLTAQEVFDIFPAPHHPETIQIYNENTYHELIESFVLDQSSSHHKATKTFKICANGGSSTAGGGGIELENRYFNKLESFLRSLDAFGGRPSEAIDRGHGSRNSLHSAIFAPNFIPPDTDLLLWEFAINDYPYSPHISKETQAVQTRHMFLGWLREIERIKPHPPKVILIYLWKTPFRPNANQQIDDPVYDFHADIAKEFDFVVGHVNVASYIDHELEELNWTEAKHYLVADAHHPSHAGHLCISFLLMVLLRGQGEWHPKFNINDKVAQSGGDKEDDHAVEKYDWFCGEDTNDKIFIRNRVLQQQNDNSYSGWRSPLGSMTLESPRNDESLSPRQLHLSGTGDIAILGKQDPVRQDRQGSISLPCCSSSDDPSTFPTVKVPIETEPMNGVKALFLAFGKNRSFMTSMKVYMTTSSSPEIKPSLSPGKLIQIPGDWPCFWSFVGIYDTWWFQFTEEYSDISSLSLCVDNPKCSVEGESGTNLLSMAVY